MMHEPTSETSSWRESVDDTVVIVFAKAPIPGQAKTRLIPALGAQGAAKLAQRMLEHVVEAACVAKLGSVEVCVAPDPVHPVFAALSARHRLLLSAQGPGDIGTRMAGALHRALCSAQSAILIGTDVPSLHAEVIRSAASALAGHDAVFVPAHDGGYVLVGLRRPAPELFTDIPWSTPQVMPRTRARARALGLRVAELTPLADVDEPKDLEHVPRSWLPAPAPSAKP